ncbi:hypothetical protein TRIUR3_01100 [Triticum urartu]|uniref:Uncharacterized protein n=1 Tax=Triticum urartu TaxID=4572 RepID=M8A509_TRIUA|nr:hypothetical protein TRIUR3_01100 [Triticum urartu]
MAGVGGGGALLPPLSLGWLVRDGHAGGDAGLPRGPAAQWQARGTAADSPSWWRRSDVLETWCGAEASPFLGGVVRDGLTRSGRISLRWVVLWHGLRAAGVVGGWLRHGFLRLGSVEVLDFAAAVSKRVVGSRRRWMLDGRRYRLPLGGQRCRLHGAPCLDLELPDLMERCPSLPVRCSTRVSMLRRCLVARFGGGRMLWHRCRVRLRMPGRRPRMMGYTVGFFGRFRGSAAPLGYMGGKGCSGGRLWLASTMPKSGVATLALVAEVFGMPLLVQEKASRLAPARGCRSLLEGIVMDLDPVPWLRVKTLVFLLGLDSGDGSRRHPPEGVVVEPRHRRSGLDEVLG